MHTINCRGMTLVELAIALVILGILVSLGASLIGPLAIRVKTTETRESVSAAVEGIIGYGATNIRLPSLAQFPGVVRTQTDSWRQAIQYVHDGNLSSSVCDRTTTNITLRVCSNAACSIFTDVTNVAFIVLSSGGNYNNQTAGSQAVGAALTINTYGTGIPVDAYTGDMSRPGDEYDDIVKWVTLPELQTKLSCGRCTAFEVWNNLGAAAYFRVNGMGCGQIPNSTLVSSLGPGGSMNGFSDSSCLMPAAPPSMTYTQAVAADANRNCAVNFNNTDR